MASWQNSIRVAATPKWLTHSGQFATAVCATFDPATLTLQYATAGHPPPLLVRATGGSEFLDRCGSAPLSTGAVNSRSATVQLAPGDSVFYYTDGLIERRDRTLDDGFTKLRTICTAPDAADGTLDQIVEALTKTAPTDDDVCLVRLHVSYTALIQRDTTRPREAIAVD